jgi:hypothetical protein
LSGFGASLSFDMKEVEKIGMGMRVLGGVNGMDGVDERKLGIRPHFVSDSDIGGDFGDGCCFGTKTVQVGMDCVWKLHGGV